MIDSDTLVYPIFEPYHEGKDAHVAQHDIFESMRRFQRDRDWGQFHEIGNVDGRVLGRALTWVSSRNIMNKDDIRQKPN
jgi:hypothetical protein